MVKPVNKSAMACNKPRSTPSHPTKSHVVKACADGKEKVIRFGQQGVKGSPEGSARNESFKARHAKNIAKGKMSAAYWADRVKWTIMPIGIGILLHAGDVDAKLQSQTDGHMPKVCAVSGGQR